MAKFAASFRSIDLEIQVSGESWDEVVQEAKGLGLDAESCLSQVVKIFGPEITESKPRLRSPPKVDPSTQDVVKSPSKDGCQECGGSFGHLTREDAIELYGLPVCSACGKLI